MGIQTSGGFKFRHAYTGIEESNALKPALALQCDANYVRDCLMQLLSRLVRLMFETDRACLRHSLDPEHHDHSKVGMPDKLETISPTSVSRHILVTLVKA